MLFLENAQSALQCFFKTNLINSWHERRTDDGRLEDEALEAPELLMRFLQTQRHLFVAVSAGTGDVESFPRPSSLSDTQMHQPGEEQWPIDNSGLYASLSISLQVGKMLKQKPIEGLKVY